MSAELSAAEVEALLDCECGHSLDEHNGLGCYAVLSYTPERIQCRCRLTDDRTHVELLALNLPAHVAALVAQAASEREQALRERVEALLAAVDRAARLSGRAAEHPEALSIRAEAEKVRAALSPEAASEVAHG